MFSNSDCTLESLGGLKKNKHLGSAARQTEFLYSVHLYVFKVLRVILIYSRSCIPLEDRTQKMYLLTFNIKKQFQGHLGGAVS